MITINLFGLVLLACGFVAAVRWARDRPDDPPAGTFPDPTATLRRARVWDGQTWTPRVLPGPEAADRGRRFRGRFWGRWVWTLLAAIAVLGLGGVGYAITDQVVVEAVASFLGMSLVCLAFYLVADRHLALHDVIGLREVAAVAVAAAGTTVLIALNLNTLVIDTSGTTTATRTVGFIEESAKFAVPLALFLLGRYRDVRAGIALGLAAGFGFAIFETTQYAFATADASGPNFCGDATPDPTVATVILAQVARIFTVSPLHWLWTGTATAIAWRAWRLRGSRGTVAAVGGLLMVMLIHSFNDSTSTFGCDSSAAAGMFQVVRWVLFVAMFFVFRAWARKSLPPPLVGRVSRGWLPKHLGADDGPADDGPPDGDGSAGDRSAGDQSA